MHIERSYSQTYYKHKDSKPKLAQTKSLPNGQINGSLKTNRSESSSRFSGSALPRLPASFRNGSVGGTNSISSNGLPNDRELNSDESTTSSSLFHGIVLVSIMLSSLISFVCSKVRRSCDSHTMTETNDCPMAVVLFFSVITIISCLISFIIYFLHLIGQCEVSWLAKRKFAIEFTVISIVVVLLIIGNSLMIKKTEVLGLGNYVGILSIVCSSLSIIGYGIRMTMLCSECKYFSRTNHQNQTDQIDQTALSIMKETLKSKLNSDSTKKWQVASDSHNSCSSNLHDSLSAMRVISYVKRKKSVESTAKSVEQQPNGTSDHLNGYDIDVDDDVFIQ